MGSCIDAGDIKGGRGWSRWYLRRNTKPSDARIRGPSPPITPPTMGPTRLLLFSGDEAFLLFVVAGELLDSGAGVFVREGGGELVDG